MRILLAELAPVLGRADENLDRIARALDASKCDLAVFPELYLSGYRIGDRAHVDARSSASPEIARLRELAASHGVDLVVGVPWRSSERAGEVWNAALLVRADRSLELQPKRYLPEFGPFEEGILFAPGPRSEPKRTTSASAGLAICYDVFFPEVTRELALAGADLLLVPSAAPVTSRRLFEKILPARAIENALPIVYVNRVGVEEGIVFGGGSVALDARGEPIEAEVRSAPGLAPEENLRLVELDLGEAARWRRFRPVLRDVGARPPDAGGASEGSEAGPSGDPDASLRAWSL